MSSELKRILCIEDDQDILDVTKICLETVGGFEVLTCTTGGDAIEAIRDLKPDLVLLDCMMPEMDGPTIVAALNLDPELKYTPVVFMTARVQQQEIEDYLALGAVAVISKPFDPMKIATQVKDAWHSARASRARA